MLLLRSDSYFARKCEIDIRLCRHQERINEKVLGEDLIAIFFVAFAQCFECVLLSGTNEII